MKILRDVPEILTPSMVMSADLNWHITFPLLNSKDFLMYGKTMILNESGTLNENISNCLLFAMEMVYAIEMCNYGIKEFWDDKVYKRALASTPPLIAGKVWNYELLSRITENYRFHLSNTIWRRQIEFRDGGSIVPAGVYPDHNMIPAHNILQMERYANAVPLFKEAEDKAGYYTSIKKEEENQKYNRVFIYYSPMPCIQLESRPGTANYYFEFYEKCDIGIYKWMERLMSALMLKSADAVFAAKDMAAVSYLEKWPDESIYPNGDVFMVSNTAPIQKLINIINGIPEGALYPNAEIWASSSCGRYLSKEVGEQIERALTETINNPSAVSGSDEYEEPGQYEKMFDRAVAEGTVTGMVPYASQIMEAINSNPGAISPERAKLMKDGAVEQENIMLKMAGLDKTWKVDRETGLLIKKTDEDFTEKSKAELAENQNQNPEGEMKTQPGKIDNILDSAFVDPGMLDKEEILNRAFVDPSVVDPAKPAEEGPEYKKDLKGDKIIRDESGWPIYIPKNYKKPDSEKTENERLLDSILNTAFLDKE